MPSIHYFKFSNNQELRKELAEFDLEKEGKEQASVFSTLSSHFIKARSEHALALSQKEEPAIFALEEHIARVIEHAGALCMRRASYKEHSASFIKERCIEKTRGYYKSVEPSKRLRIRLILSKDSFELTLEELVPNWNEDYAIALISVEEERESPTLKTSKVSPSVRARKKALAAGAEEALLVSKEGKVKEGSYSNIFWFDKSGELFTPKTDLLAGITRQTVFKLHIAKEKDVRLDELLLEASEVFITQSTTGISPVKSIDGKIIGEGDFARTQELRAHYKDYVEKNSWPVFGN